VYRGVKRGRSRGGVDVGLGRGERGAKGGHVAWPRCGKPRRGAQTVPGAPHGAIARLGLLKAVPACVGRNDKRQREKSAVGCSQLPPLGYPESPISNRQAYLFQGLSPAPVTFLL